MAESPERLINRGEFLPLGETFTADMRIAHALENVAYDLQRIADSLANDKSVVQALKGITAGLQGIRR